MDSELSCIASVEDEYVSEINDVDKRGMRRPRVEVSKSVNVISRIGARCSLRHFV